MTAPVNLGRPAESERGGRVSNGRPSNQPEGRIGGDPSAPAMSRPAPARRADPADPRAQAAADLLADLTNQARSRERAAS